MNDVAQESIRFDGPDYDPDLDRERLRAQLARVKALMLDGRERTLSQISEATGDPEGSIGARLRDLRKKRFGSYLVPKHRVGGTWWYAVQARPESADGNRQVDETQTQHASRDREQEP